MEADPYAPSVSIWRTYAGGSELRGLPDGCLVTDEIDRCEALLTEHYRCPSDDRIDVTAGWDDDATRRGFVAATDALVAALRAAVGPAWTVEVDRSPGVVPVRVMGEYFCDWPLWTTSHGATSPEDWPQLSSEMVSRLQDWALRAEPGHVPQPAADETAGLVRDVQAELGDRFVVTG